MQFFAEGLTDCNGENHSTSKTKKTRVISPMGQDLQYMSYQMPFADPGPDASKETFDVVDVDVHFCECSLTFNFIKYHFQTTTIIILYFSSQQSR